MINGFHGYTLSNIKYNAAQPTFVVKHMIVYGFRKFNIMECFQRELEIPIEFGRFFWGELGLTPGYFGFIWKTVFFFSICNLAFLLSTLGHSWGDSFSHSMLFIECVKFWPPKGHWETHNMVGSLIPGTMS